VKKLACRDGLPADVDLRCLSVACSALIASINADDANRRLHADFGPGSPDPRRPWGIPFTVVDSNPSKCQTFAAGPTNFLLYPEESDLAAGRASNKHMHAARAADLTSSTGSYMHFRIMFGMCKVQYYLV
jgi:hypothetical protein